MNIAACMLSCPERNEIRNQTLSNLRRAGWSEDVVLEIDESTFTRRQERQEHGAFELLRRSEGVDADFILFLEDDLDFNVHLVRNLDRWQPLIQLAAGSHFFGSLYNPTVYARSWNLDHAYFIADPEAVYGSQAFILARSTARYIIEHWNEVPGMQDIKMSRLAARVCPLYYHIPSLVQHVGDSSVWGGPYHWTNDFSPDWHAE